MSRTKVHSRERTRVAWLQTAYHQADAAATLREDPDSGWRWLVVRAEAPYEVLTWERWERAVCVADGVVDCPFPADAVAERARRMGPTAAARGLGNRPVSAEECPFKPEHFEGPTPQPTLYQNKVMFADPAGDATKLKTGDPDWCAVVVIGWHPDDKCWDVLAADRMRGSPSQQAEFIASRACAWHVRSFYQEAVKDEALVTVVQRVLRERGASVAVRPEKPTTNKLVRITQALEPALAAGILRVCGQRFPELRAEALTFPVAAHDDLLDALAGAYAKAKVGPSLLLAGAPSRSKYAIALDGIMPNPPGEW